MGRFFADYLADRMIQSSVIWLVVQEGLQEAMHMPGENGRN